MSRPSPSEAFPALANLDRGVSSRGFFARQASAAHQSPRVTFIAEAISYISNIFASRSIDLARVAEVFPEGTAVYQFNTEWDPDYFVLLVENAFPNVKVRSQADAQVIFEAKRKLYDHVDFMDDMFMDMHQAGFDIGGVRGPLEVVLQTIVGSYTELPRRALAKYIRKLAEERDTRVTSHEAALPSPSDMRTPIRDGDFEYYENLKEEVNNPTVPHPAYYPHVETVRSSLRTPRRDRSPSLPRPAPRPIHLVTPDSKETASAMKSSSQVRKIEQKRSSTLAPNATRSHSQAPPQPGRNRDNNPMHYINPGSPPPLIFEQLETALSLWSHRFMTVSGPCPNYNYPNYSFPGAYETYPSPSPPFDSSPSRSYSSSQYSSTVQGYFYPSDSDQAYYHISQYSDSRACPRYARLPVYSEHRGQQYCANRTINNGKPAHLSRRPRLYDFYNNTESYHFPQTNHDEDGDDEPFVFPSPYFYDTTSKLQTSWIV